MVVIDVHDKIELESDHMSSKISGTCRVTFKIFLNEKQKKRTNCFCYGHWAPRWESPAPRVKVLQFKVSLVFPCRSALH